MDRNFTGLLAVMVLVGIGLLVAAGYGLAPGSDDGSPAAVQTRNASLEYVEKLFASDRVTDIYITLEAADFADMMENPTEEEYKEAAITVDGETMAHVGFRVKGNSSLSSVARSDSQRFSFKVDLDQYIDGQTLFGLTKLNLNNSFSDPSFMREYLSYGLMEEMGVPTPAYSYANVYVNGQPIGLYLAVEGIEEPFLQRYYGSAAGNLYKPEGTGSDLVYVDDDMSSYSGIVAAIDKKNGADEALLAMLRALSQGQDLEAYLNVDEILRYFAVNTVLVNMDSYQGNLKHNYYLYEENGIFSILPWDYNMSFGGFGMGTGAQGATSLYIDTPVTGTTLEQRPLLGRLLEIPEYMQRYHQYIEEFIAGPFAAEKMEAEIARVAAMIRPHLEQDPTKFTTMEQFEQALAQGAADAGEEMRAPGGATDTAPQRAANTAGGVESGASDGLAGADGRAAAGEAASTAPAVKSAEAQESADANQAAPAAQNEAAGMNRKAMDGMTQGSNSIGLMRFIAERIDNVNQQLSGQLPAAGDTQSQSGGMKSGPQDAGNAGRQRTAGERPQPPEGMRQRDPAMGLGQQDAEAGQRPGPGGEAGQGFPGRVQGISAQEFYIIGGAMLLIVLTVLLAAKRRTRHTV